jgi:hypothetical protein
MLNDAKILVLNVAFFSDCRRSQYPRPPNKKKFEEDLEDLTKQIRGKEGAFVSLKQLVCCAIRLGEMSIVYCSFSARRL